MSQENRTTGLVGSAHTETRPTPIWISRRTRTALLLGGLIALVLLMWLSPNVSILTPRVQGHSLRIPAVLIFLAIIAAGELAGFLGVTFRPDRARAKRYLRLLPRSTSYQELEAVREVRIGPELKPQTAAKWDEEALFRPWKATKWRLRRLL